MPRADSLEITLMLGKTEGKRRRGQQRIRWLDSITRLTDMNLSNLREEPGYSSSQQGAGSSLYTVWGWLPPLGSGLDQQCFVCYPRYHFWLWQWQSHLIPLLCWETPLLAFLPGYQPLTSPWDPCWRLSTPPLHSAAARGQGATFAPSPEQGEACSGQGEAC